jgi:hypothetical protein
MRYQGTVYNNAVGLEALRLDPESTGRRIKGSSLPFRVPCRSLIVVVTNPLLPRRGFAMRVGLRSEAEHGTEAAARACNAVTSDSRQDGIRSATRAIRAGEPAQTTPPRDALFRKIEDDLRWCSPSVVRYVAAIVAALARSRR